MTRLMFDSTNPADIPTTAEIVAGYINGPYAWSAAGWARFPNAIKVRIATLATVLDGDCLDVETSDATPAEAPGWVVKRRAAGVPAAVYMNESTWPAVRSAFATQGVAEPYYWVAAYDGNPAIPAGAHAHQYADSVTSGGHYDLSSCDATWPISSPTGGFLDMLSDAQQITLLNNVQEIHNVLFNPGPGGGPARDEMYNEHQAILAAVKAIPASGGAPTSLKGSLTGTATP